jgi:hypothetical protein
VDASANAETLALVACAGAALALIAAVVAVVSLARMRRAQRILVGDGERDLVSHAADLQSEFEALHAYVGNVVTQLDARLVAAEMRLDGAIARRGLIRYDAYHEMSGRQSFSLALLDAAHSGVLISSIHHREQARMYTKHVTGGHGDIALTPEEEEAIRLAIAGAPPPLPQPEEQ